MKSAKTPFLAVLLICLGWSGNAVVQVTDPAGTDKKPTHDLPVTVEPFSMMRGLDRTPSGAPAADATYAFEPFSYEWIDTSAGTLIPMMDDTYALAIPIGFDFPFHGIAQETVNVSANGFLSFFAPNGTYFTNGLIPSATQPNGIIAPFWDDLRPEEIGEVRYLTQGAAPEPDPNFRPGTRIFTMTWTGVPHYSQGGDIGAVTFQVTLYETTGDIVFRYQDVLFEDPAFDNGASATIGVENGRGNSGAVFSINSAGISNGDALRFYPLEANRAYDIAPEPHSWIDATTGQDIQLGDDESAIVPLGFDFRYFGTDYDRVNLSSNGYLTFGSNCPFIYTSQVLPYGIIESDHCDRNKDVSGFNTGSTVNAVIAPLWDDLNPSAGSVFALSQGVAPDRSVTFSWNGVPHFPNIGAVTFQATLHENGDVLFSYQDVDFGAPGLDGGENAIVGVEDEYGLSASQYSFRIPSLNGQSLRLSPANVRPVSALGNSTLAVLPGGSATGWGQNGNGQLGNLTMIDGHTPAYAVDGNGIPVRDIIAVSSSSVVSSVHHSMVLTRDGRVLASGNNGWGQLGDGTFTSRSFAAEATGAAGSVAVAVGLIHSLSLRADGAVLSWGYNGNGELGDGTTTDRSGPGLVLASAGGAPLAGIASIATGVGHNLALRDDGTIFSWGDNADGQLGDGTFTGSTVPVNIACCATQIAAGAYHSIALMTDGTVMAWGRGTSGQLGNNSFTTSENPVVVVDGTGTPIQATSVSAGSFHCLAIDNSGQLLAWGNNGAGQLGNGSQASRAFAAPVLIEGGLPLDMVAAVSGGWQHSVARKTDGTLWVWGSNSNGQLGIFAGSVSNKLYATPIQLGTDVSVNLVAPLFVGQDEFFDVAVTVVNNGPIDASGVKLTFSPGFLAVSPDPDIVPEVRLPFFCDAPFNSNDVTCMLGLLPANSSSTIIFPLIEEFYGGYYQTTATVSAPQDNTSFGNSRSATIQVPGADGCEPDNSLAEAREWPDETEILCAGHTLVPVNDIDYIKLYADGKVCDPMNSACVECSNRYVLDGGPSKSPDACAALETVPFDLFIAYTSEGGLAFSVHDEHQNLLLPGQDYNSPCLGDDGSGGTFATENCVEITNGYEGDLYIGVQGLQNQFGWTVRTHYDSSGPADEVYVVAEMNIDTDALSAMGYSVFTRLTGDFQTVVEYPNVMAAGFNFGGGVFVRLELWLADPTAITPDNSCAGNPALCIFTTDEEQLDFGWGWGNDVGYSVVPIEFPDGDADGIPDVLEAQYAGTCPGGNDCDNDGVIDTVDNCYTVYNPTQANHDGDEFGDTCDDDDDDDGSLDVDDNCPMIPNAGQADSNGNDIGDACDGTTEIAICSTTSIEVNNINPVVTQDLQSGVADTILSLRTQVQATHTYAGDLQMVLQHVATTTNVSLVDDSPNCAGDDWRLLLDNTAAATVGDQCASSGVPSTGILRPTGLLQDFNGEVLSGVWRMTVTDLFPPSDDGTLDGWCLFARVADADNDGEPDSTDNCPIVHNAEQIDTDNDGIGNVCDNCPTNDNAAQSDTDNDGIGNVCDNCTLVSNPIQLDTDVDLIGNYCDPDIAIPNDNFVNFLDLNLMKDAFFTNPISPDWNPDADFNGDDFVNFLDLNIMKDAFFGPPGPSGLVP